MLLPYYQPRLTEAGCDEAGRGCLAGPVFAAAVILPKTFKNEWLNDSKKLNEKKRNELRSIIENEATDFAVASLDNQVIDDINILNASIQSMHLALKELSRPFAYIIVDGNRFKPYKNIPHQTIVEGDGKYMSIAAASILAKTYRDAWMEQAHEQYPQYGWRQNKGYATAAHRQAILQHGQCPLHRKSFVLKEAQLKIFS
ncbi:MAG: ribonuclease HII [Bacteroidetes bacterium]|nr:ribonuclease HII [Bacteroidota bacterium]MBK8659325.1 ribonuclease HII [Bacteroidota bacterium]